LAIGRNKGNKDKAVILANKPAMISRDKACGRNLLATNLTNQTTSTVRSKFLKISLTTYIEDKQYTEL